MYPITGRGQYGMSKNREEKTSAFLLNLLKKFGIMSSFYPRIKAALNKMDPSRLLQACLKWRVKLGL